MNCAQHTFRQGHDYCLVCKEPAPWVSKDTIMGIGGISKKQNSKDKKARREENLRRRAEDNRKKHNSAALQARKKAPKGSGP